MSAQFDVKSLYDLSGKVAVVTGSAQGIGSEIARFLAAAGAHVVVSGVRPEGAAATAREICAAGGQAMPIAFDQADEQAVVEFFRTVRARLRRLDILVNNAAIQDRARLEDCTAELWDRIHAVNLRGPFLCTREAARIMKADQTAGRIVNVSSLGSMKAMLEGLTAYSASKGGMNALTRNCAIELGPHGITVNAVLPGTVPTRGAMSAPGPAISEDMIPSLLPPVGHFGTPADIAHAVLFLVSPAAGFITGQTLVVDGGMQAR